jgi:hypothetical protein
LASGVVDWNKCIIRIVEDSTTHATNTILSAIGDIESSLVSTLLPDIIEVLIIGVVPNIVKTLCKHVKISK